MSILVLAISLGVGISLVVDFLERVAMFIQHGTDLGLALKYVFLRTPWYVSNVLPLAYLLSVLLVLGRLTKQNEVIAMRAGGISLRQITQAILSIALVVSLFSFVWNEWVVPAAFTRAEKTRKIEIQKKDPKGVLSNQGIWVRGDDAFYQIDLFDRRMATLKGIRIFLLDREFNLTGVVEADAARWTGREWVMHGARERVFSPPHWEATVVSRSTYRISEPMEEFDILSKEPEEFGIFELREYIAILRSKGIDVKSHEVDWQIKLSKTFLPLIMAIIAIPFALRHPRMGGVAASFSSSLAIGFSFWVVQAVGISLARGGAMHPFIAAWLPHLIFSLIGFYYFLGVEE
jgi:lipopolysaccharide export system permease protein